MFLFRLALALGRTVGELEESMTAAELIEWQEFYNIEPFGDLRGDARIGVLGAGVAALLGAKNVKVSDFMPNFKGKRKLTPQEEITQLKAIAGLAKALELSQKRGRKP